MSKYPDKGTLVAGILLIFGLVFTGTLVHGQETIDGSEWFEAFPRKNLMVVYPTFSVKHDRIRATLSGQDGRSGNEKRANQMIARDLAYRDSLLIALAASFRQEYHLNTVYLMPDTSYVRWTRGERSVLVRDLDLQEVRQTWSEQEVAILRKSRSSRDTGTGVEQWVLITPSGVVLPAKVPRQFREGSVGLRFVRFFEAFFSFSQRPERVEELRVGTDYLARQTQKKWSRYLDRTHH